MTTSQYTGLYQFRSGTISLTDGQFTSPLLNSNGELVVDLGATIFQLSGSNSLGVSLIDKSGALDASLSGPGSPVVVSYTNAAISSAANKADQVLVGSPGASEQIWVYGIQFTLSTADGTVSIQESDNTPITGVMNFTLTSGLGLPPSGNFTMPLWKVGTNKALHVDTVTCSIKGSIQYAIVSV